MTVVSITWFPLSFRWTNVRPKRRSIPFAASARRSVPSAPNASHIHPATSSVVASSARPGRFIVASS